MGAVPFITAAKMTDNPTIKAFLYLSSTLCGLSRINDNAHYFSQSALGWWLAYLAAISVGETKTEKRKIVFAPVFISDGAGVAARVRF